MTANEPIKIVFWDLDGTLWGGTLEEDADTATVPFRSVCDMLRLFDQRGILNSVVSQASAEAAVPRLKEYEIYPLFLRPKFNVSNKAQAIATTLNELRLLPTNAAFIDDLPFYRAEVSQLLPDVLVASPDELPQLHSNPRFQGSSALGPARRVMYQADEQREAEALTFVGSRSEFLRSCNMVLTCGMADENSALRLQELFSRAHRLSSMPAGEHYAIGAFTPTTGATRQYIGALHDRFGDYGVIAGAVIQLASAGDMTARCELLAISCRVQGRGVLEAFVGWLVNRCRPSHLQIPISTKDLVNQPLRTALRFCGFAPISKGNDHEVLALASPERLLTPEWIKVVDKP